MGKIGYFSTSCEKLGRTFISEVVVHGSVLIYIVLEGRVQKIWGRFGDICGETEI